ncbi:MAG: Dabb family protein [Candidatus Liberibacter ctenarytainae]|uniref:Dabb family protein n=1 Tax=Candidatus Liberibacter ctenarytainae TaxID=2020335 RepID=A0A937AJ29_9HYPH|nr:Dabb family protein [Candidatus Liberibacter ctenarytainae]
MIRHIIFFTVLPKHYEAVRSSLAILLDIPHAQLLEIGDNLRIDSWSNEVDLVVYGEFYNQESLNSFKKHPLYQQSIARVRHLRDMRFVADYDTDCAAKLPI